LTNPTQSCRALVLDFDGVIIESNALKTLTFREVFARFPEHLDAMMDWHESHMPESRYTKFRHLAERLGQADDETLVASLAKDFSSRMIDRAVTCPVVRGAIELLADLADRVPLFVVSLTPEPELRQILDRRELTSFFAGIFGCPPWSKASALQCIIDRIGGRDGVVFVGDSAGDQRAARDCGIRFIGRESGLAFDEPRPAVCADLIAVREILSASICR